MTQNVHNYDSTMVTTSRDAGGTMEVIEGAELSVVAEFNDDLAKSAGQTLASQLVVHSEDVGEAGEMCYLACISDNSTLSAQDSNDRDVLNAIGSCTKGCKDAINPTGSNDAFGYISQSSIDVKAGATLRVGEGTTADVAGVTLAPGGKISISQGLNGITSSDPALKIRGTFTPVVSTGGRRLSAQNRASLVIDRSGISAQAGTPSQSALHLSGVKSALLPAALQLTVHVPSDRGSWAAAFAAPLLTYIESKRRRLSSGACNTVDGDACTFPFTHGGNTYTACTNDGWTTHWCGTSGGEWGVCDCSTCDCGGDQTPVPQSQCVMSITVISAGADVSHCYGCTMSNGEVKLMCVCS